MAPKLTKAARERSAPNAGRIGTECALISALLFAAVFGLRLLGDRLALAWKVDEGPAWFLDVSAVIDGIAGAIATPARWSARAGWPS